jgi:uncharacterized protein (TIGR03435 family)
MTRFLLLVCASIIVVAQPAFEVVSIKASPRGTPEDVISGKVRVGYKLEGDRLDFTGYPLTTILARAFRVEIQQVDLRNLAGTNVFEILAKLPPGATEAQVPEMLQTMLADRFKLKYHRETREYPVTVLTVGKNGMKLPRLPDGTPESSKRETGRIISVGTVKSLFPVMNSFGGFPQMIDETGLDGTYTWIQETSPLRPGQSFQEMTREAFESMLDAAGLKLEARKVPKETIVVDSIEKLPTEN